MRVLARLLPIVTVASLLACGSSTSNGGGDLDFGGGIDLSYGDGTEPGEDVPATGDTEDDPGVCTVCGNEYPNAELLLKITGPTGLGYSTTAGSNVALSGIIFGKANTAISYIATKSGAMGTATGAPFWMTDYIPLVPGDNPITVTVQGDEGNVSDTIVVAYNPAFLFPNLVEVRPPALFAGETQEIHVTLALGAFGAMVGSTLTLEQVDATGAKVVDLGKMIDDGKVGSSGDEIQDDGVYTLQVSLAGCTAGQPVYVRAAVQAKDYSGQVYTAKSAPVPVDCVARLTTATCQSHQAILGKAKTAYQNALSQGPGAARVAALGVLQADPAFSDAATATDGGGVWVMWNDGVIGALNVGTAADRGGAGDDGEPAVGVGTAGAATDEDLASIQAALTVGGTDAGTPITSKNTLLLSPFNGDFGSDDETQFIGKLASDTSCPAYNVLGPYNGVKATLDWFRQMNTAGILAIATHGDTYFKTLAPDQKKRLNWFHMGSQEVLWTGEKVDCGKLATTTKKCSTDGDCTGSGAKCLITKASYSGGDALVSGVCFDATQVDLMAGRLVLGDLTWGVTPSFVLKYGGVQKYPQSVVYLGACRSMYNGTLLSAFFSSGAKVVAGYSNVVGSQFAGQMGSHFFTQLIQQKESAGSAYGIGAQDPGHPGSFFRFFGARDLSVAGSDILNSSWETGDLTAWEREGDGRVISKLGIAKAVQGKFMSIISTGLGFTTQLGSIEQTFCIPAGLTTMSFFWKYYSEEFHEYCGSAYQDTFSAMLTDANGKEYKVLYANVDALCCANDCSGCGSYWKGKTCGLTPSDVQFDIGDTHVTAAWQKSTFNISSLSGQGPVTLKFFCTDKGDSVYDTAVLVDAVRFE